MANIFRVLKKKLGALNAELRFSREPLDLEMIHEKITLIEEIFEFAKEYAASFHHESSSNVGDRLYYYLTEGHLNYEKVADHFKVPYGTIASNVHYASEAFSKLIGDLVNRLTEAEDLEIVRTALSEFSKIKKNVLNPYDLPEISLKKFQKRKGGSLPYIKNSPYIVIPSRY